MNDSHLSAWRGAGLRALVLSGLLLLVSPVRAALQFDVFLGYGGQPTGVDGHVREASWFSLGCEILNDGASFNGVIELANGGQGQVTQFALELPTNTRKRFVLPVFCPGRGGVWSARLLDERGRERAKVERLMPRVVMWESLLMGAVPRSFSGAPQLPDLVDQNARGEMEPRVARIPVELVPDNPIALEGLEILYLNSEKVLELKEPQAEAIVSWVHGGGHLMVAVEQSADVNTTAWLRNLLPCSVGSMGMHRTTPDLHRWLRPTPGTGAPTDVDTPRQPGVSYLRPVKYWADGRDRGAGDEMLRLVSALVPDPGFEGVEFAVAQARAVEGEVVMSLGEVPLAVSAARERGRVTVLLFSPEREPFRSWKHRSWMWAKLVHLPPSWFTSLHLIANGGQGLDGVVGAMIDSRQVRKLPVRWLLVLLVVYLGVIGPFDQWLLKRLNRQMLTWVTFPCYVVLFSLLIYYIGYRLRAGETEWSELQMVDVVPRGPVAELRGRTFMSIYSPVNSRYAMASRVAHAAVRSELTSSYAGGREGSRLDVRQLDQGFDAEVFVPVWTSQLLVSDWVQSESPPLDALVRGQGAQRELVVRNHLAVPLEDVRLVQGGQVVFAGRVLAGQERTVPLASAAPRPWLEVLQETESRDFHRRVQARSRAFGASQEATLALNPGNLMALSLLGEMRSPQNFERTFLDPGGVDLTRFVERGDAVVLAWVPGHAASPSLRRFNAMRSSQNTFYRLVIPKGH